MRFGRWGVGREAAGPRGGRCLRFLRATTATPFTLLPFSFDALRYLLPPTARSAQRADLRAAAVAALRGARRGAAALRDAGLLRALPDDAAHALRSLLPEEEDAGTAVAAAPAAAPPPAPPTLLAAALAADGGAAALHALLLAGGYGVAPEAAELAANGGAPPTRPSPKRARVA